MGRPTKYTPEILKKCEEYINNFLPFNGDRCATGVIPSPTGLAVHLNVSKSTVYDWANDENKEFSDFLERVNTLREEYLSVGGLSGQSNSVITKLMLTKHGYSDKQETELSGQLETKDVSAVDAVEQFLATKSR